MHQHIKFQHNQAMPSWVTDRFITFYRLVFFWGVSLSCGNELGPYNKFGSYIIGASNARINLHISTKWERFKCDRRQKSRPNFGFYPWKIRGEVAKCLQSHGFKFSEDRSITYFLCGAAAARAGRFYTFSSWYIRGNFLTPNSHYLHEIGKIDRTIIGAPNVGFRF